MKSLRNKIQIDKQTIIFTVCFLSIVAILAIVTMKGGKQPTTDAELTITAEEIAEYRDRIGGDMDVKKAVVLIFNTEDECQGFIDEHGNSGDVLSLGKGLAPHMQEDETGKYYNVVGNGIFEPIFDNLQDGEYAQEPIEFGGMFCFFKRLNNFRFIDDEEKLKELIIREKEAAEHENPM